MCKPGTRITRPYRNYVYTTFEEDPPAYDVDNMWYLCYQREICPSTGKEHYQCYVEFKQPQRPTGAQRLVGGNGHFCVRSGTREQAIAYCKKEESAVPDSWREFGDASRTGEERKTQGKRSDLDDIAEAIQDGSQPDDIAEQFPKSYIRYHRGIEKLHQAVSRRTKRSWATDIVIIWGPTGTGKTRQVFAREGADNVYVKPSDGAKASTWFDGYTGQRVVLIDDYVPGQYSIGQFLVWADRYPCQVPVKGGFVNFIPRRIYITSNYDPAEWWPASESASVPAFNRRVSEIIQQADEWVPDSPRERDNEASLALCDLSSGDRDMGDGESTYAAIPIDLTQDDE